VSDPLEDARAELAAAPLEDWTAERGRLAKALKADGHAEAAKTLAKDPKPSAAAWALGWAAREEPDAVGEWNGAAAALRQASTSGDGDALRSAMAEHREATERLVGLVAEGAQPGGKPLSEAMVQRVRELLQEATSDPEGIGGVRAAAPRARERGSGPKTDPAEERRARRRAELEREAADAEREAEARATAAEEAEARAEEAQEAAQTAQAEALEARRAATAAGKEAEKLRKRLERES
jgi:hypothetical protein